MRNKTINKYEGILDAIIESGMSVSKYCKEVANISDKYFYTQMKKIAEGAIEDIEIRNRLLHKYEIAKRNRSDSNAEIVDNNDISEAFYERDSDGKIVSYRYKIYKKNKPVLDGSLSRDEMRTIYRLYTWYGDGLTARVVSRHFPELSLPDFKRILKVFNVYKDNCPFPAHMIEELSEDELREIQLREKENSFLRKAEEDDIKNDKKLLKKYANENIELKQQLSDKKELIQELFNCDIEFDKIQPIINNTTENDIVIYLSDLHIGAFNEKYGYIQLEDYSKEEITRRLNKVIDFIKNNKYHSITVCNLGDSVDSYNKQTTRGGHDLPTIISNKEQSQLYLEIMLEFFNKLFAITEEISYICVGESNHDGDWGWINNVVLSEKLEKTFGIKSYISNNSIDKFDINDVSIIYLHGKDTKNQFKGFPLTLDFKTESWFNSYFIDSNQQFKKKKCIVKGDLHQYAYTCAKHFDYISAPSLYGSSNWIVSNFGKTPWGVLVMEIDNNSNIKTYIIKE